MNKYILKRVYVEIQQMHGSYLGDIFVRGTWFVDELCQHSVRGSAVVKDTVNRIIIKVWRNQI